MAQCTHPAYYPQMTYIGIKDFYGVSFDEYILTRVMGGGRSYGYKCLIQKCSQKEHLFTNPQKARKHVRNAHRKDIILDSRPKNDMQEM